MNTKLKGVLKVLEMIGNWLNELRPEKMTEEEGERKERERERATKRQGCFEKSTSSKRSRKRLT